MKLTNQSYTRTIKLAITLVAMLLVACAGPDDQAANSGPAVNSQTAARAPADAVPATSMPATSAPTPLATVDTEIPAIDEPGAVDDSPTSDELAPPKPTSSPIADRNPVDRNPTDAGSLNTSCKVDADCEIKDVGSCCGFYPRCLNRGTQTFPDRVKAQCGNEGRVSTCGFPAITSCECVQGKCSGVTISDDDQLVR